MGCSVSYRITIGPQQGRKVFTLQTLPAWEDDDRFAQVEKESGFSLHAGVWSQQAYLEAGHTDGGDQFGASVAISGDTLVVGAPEEDGSATGGEADNSAPGAGVVYTWQ